MLFRSCLFLTVAFSCNVYADSVEWFSRQGDSLTVQRVSTGELWASFTLTDQMSAGFAPHELLVLQVDEHKPIKLQQAFRSCAAPAVQGPQFSYQYNTASQSNKWLFEGVSSHKPDPLKLLGWDQEEFDTIKADRRSIVVDFPLNRNAAGKALIQQLRQGRQITFRYVIDTGEAKTAVFDLQQQRSQTQRLLAD